MLAVCPRLNQTNRRCRPRAEVPGAEFGAQYRPVDRSTASLADFTLSTNCRLGVACPVRSVNERVKQHKPATTAASDTEGKPFGWASVLEIVAANLRARPSSLGDLVLLPHVPQ